MCGFVGLFSPEPLPDREESSRELLTRMATTLTHRGPDDHGVWLDAGAGIGLGHRRLSIIDLSEAGRQPMVSACGRFVVAYNGEIYNFKTLRSELEPHYAFRGHSDTDVLLAAVAHWGLEEALCRMNGMFAFALWDREQRVLHLARDRLGKKPLYYGWAGDDLVFGSELKALCAHPRFEGKVDRRALTLYLRYTYVPAPFSIYTRAYKLPQASTLSLRVEDLKTGRGAPFSRSSVYWDPLDALDAPERPADAEAVESLDRLLRDAVATRMIADVPLGAFLSGGIDSSTVVALMQAQSSRPVKTFSIGFHHEDDEAGYAGEVARHIGTEHHEMYVTGDDTLAVVDEMPRVFDEPFADTSQIPTLIISRLARREVTVILSGDGGDELFFGYRRYFRGKKLWPALRSVPLGLRSALGRAVLSASGGAIREGKLLNLAADLQAATVDSMFHNRVSRFKSPTAVLLEGEEPRTIFDEMTERLDRTVVREPEARMMLTDLVTYLTDDILVKVDRASMAASLELRAPLLDYRVVEMAIRLPTEMKYRNGVSKWTLRQVLARYVPPKLTDRQKMGFGAPIRLWLRGALREWGEELLDPARLKREGYFRPEPLRAMWDENLAGRRKWHNHLWPILMFQAWLRDRR